MQTYRNQLIQLLADLKLRKPAEREPALQTFFEAHPDLITRPHYIHSKVVLSKLAIGSWRTDFAYINPQSGFHMLYLIEIEDPEKDIFTASDDQFTADFNHALQQVHDWMSWTASNRDYIQQVYGDLDKQFSGNEQGFLIARGVLIYGRREQTGLNPIRAERWRQKKEAELASKVEIMTYDGLMERNLPAFRADQRTEFDCTTYAYGRRAFRKKL
ncbi:Shedu immune nuclease family protein [Agrobacterium sp. 22094]|uniref:Shedu immune nuclease family protein n=1 Tax=Agrobacterium sp. 22094 TaxID=3453872 RepID=UPI003F84FC37